MGIILDDNDDRKPVDVYIDGCSGSKWTCVGLPAAVAADGQIGLIRQ